MENITSGSINKTTPVGICKTDTKYPLVSGKLPVILSVSGIDGIPEENYVSIREKTKYVLQRIKAVLSDTPLYMMSTFLTDSQRLVCEIADEENIPIIFVLPYELKKYRKEFVSSDAYAFEHLYNIAVKTVSIYENEKMLIHTDIQYSLKNALNFMRENSLIMLELSDDEPKAFIPYDNNPTNNKTIHIKTPQDGGKYTPNVMSVELSELNDDKLSEILNGIQAYNKDITNSNIPTSDSTINDENTSKDCYKKTAELALNLSEKNKKHYKNILNILFFLTLAAMCSFVLFTICKFAFALLLCAVFIIADILTYSCFAIKDSKTKSKDYMLLSKLSSLQAEISALGINCNAYDCLSISQKNEIPWIVSGLRALKFINGDANTDYTDLEVNRQAVKEFAIKNANHHALCAQKQEKMTKRERTAVNITGILSGSLFVTLIILALSVPPAVMLSLNTSYFTYILMAPVTEITFGCIFSLFSLLCIKRLISPYPKRLEYHNKLKESYLSASDNLQNNENISSDIFLDMLVDDIELSFTLRI